MENHRIIQMASVSIGWLALLIRLSASLVLSIVPFLSSNLFSFSYYLDTLIQSGAGFKDSPLTPLGLAVSSSRAAIAEDQHI